MIGKRFLPSTLFGRVLLILLLPTVLIQAVMLYIFFDRHWNNVSRHLSRVLAGETVFVVKQMQDLHGTTVTPAIFDFDTATDIDVFLDPVDIFDTVESSADFPEYQEQLRIRLSQAFKVRNVSGDMVQTYVQMPDKTLRLEAPVKRLESRTTIILVLWMLGTTTLFLLIAGIFLRNQIRPIRKLAKAADDFGRGVDSPDFKPSGALEVRTASRAFMVMRERIKRQLRTRADMLAGISHDLRTPLTRMKLELAMLGNTQAVRELKDDVQQMEHMIEEYLDFARGVGGEETQHISLYALLDDIVADYQRHGAQLVLEATQDVHIDLRISAIRRMVHNLIDNALRYGSSSQVILRATGARCEIVVDDNGPGIPAEKHEEVFQPFRRLDPSRNTKTGGVGLGLSIARDIALSHGGHIALQQSPAGGLRVVVSLPIYREDA